MNTLSVTVADGKYTVLQDEFGRLSALRYGEQWRNCVGDGLVLALAQEVRKLEDLYKKDVSSVAVSALITETECEESYQKLLEAEKVIAELKAEVAAVRTTLLPYAGFYGSVTDFSTPAIAEEVVSLIKQEAYCAREEQEKIKALQKEVTELKQQVEELEDAKYGKWGDR